MTEGIESIGDEEGKILVRIAGDTVDSYLKKGDKIEMPGNIPVALEHKIGIFVTLKKAEKSKEKSIASMGYLLPVKPLAEGIIDSAIAAAIRAQSNGLESIEGVHIEAGIIGALERIKADRRADISTQIKIGEDGILIERDFHRALYLPHIALEHGWDAVDFLGECCVKAGLMPDAWLDTETEVYKFKVKVFR